MDELGKNMLKNKMGNLLKKRQSHFKLNIND